MEPTRVDELLEQVEALLPEVLRARVPSAPRRREVLGGVWERCFQEVTRQPERFHGAAAAGELPELLDALVEAALGEAGEPGPEPRLRSGAVGVFVDAQLRDVSPVPAPADGAPAHPLVADAVADARRRQDRTLLRNLDWMQRRDRGESYAALARELDVKEATVRTGVRRARQEVRRLAYHRERAATAPHRGGCPEPLRPAREAFEAGDPVAGLRHLEAARPEHGGHPYFVYLEALMTDDVGERERAAELLCRVLVIDDDALLRAKALNVLGCIADDRGDLEEAGALWARAHALEPGYVPPLVNLLKNACDRRDALAVHVALDDVGALLSGGTLSDADRDYLVRRLAGHPDLGFARRFDAWRRGPARWVARLAQRQPGRTPRGEGFGHLRAAARALGVALALALWATAPLPAFAGVDDASGLDASRSGDRGAHGPQLPPPVAARGAVAVVARG